MSTPLTKLNLINLWTDICAPLLNILCMFSSVASVSVALVELLPVTLSVFVAGRRVTARRTATPPWLLGPCLRLLPRQLSCCGWSRHGGGGGGSCVIHGRWGWPCGANVWQRSPKKKPQRGSIWWICKGSGRALSHSKPPTLHRHERDWCFSCFSTAGTLRKD